MMPALALVSIARPRWLPPLPVFLFLLWPFVLICAGVARLLDGARPDDAAKLRAAIEVFRELRGLTIDMDPADHARIQIRFL